MGRISDAFKRISPSSTSGVSDAAPMLDEYARERHSRHDEPMATVAAVPSPKPAVHRAAPTPIAATPELVAAAPRATPPAPPEPEAERLIDVQQIGNYIGFVGRAVLRNRVIAAGTLGLMLAATVAGARFWPKTYEVDARLLLQRNEVMASLVNPGRTISREAESPTHAAEEIVLQRDNLLSLIKETDLVKEWDRSRAGLLRMKDWIYGLFRPTTDEDRLDAMVGLLEKRLRISATPEGAVTFNLLWPDGQVAYQMVDRAIQNFLQVRKQNETSAIADSIAILDRSVQTLEAQVSQTMSELPKRRPVVTSVKRPAPNPAVLPPTPSGPPAELVARAAKTKAALDAKVEEVTRLDNLRRQQLAEAQGRLAQATAVYTEGHPTIVALRQNIAQLQREPADLTAARRDAQNLEAEYEAVSGVLQTDRNEAEEATRKAAIAALGAAEPLQSIDYGALAGATETNDPISLRLKVELSELATVRERANAARAELSSAQAGFKYQYSMIRPPQVPRRPASPNVPAILAAGALASLLMAVVAAVTADMARGRILEPWQVERLVGVPVSVRL